MTGFIFSPSWYRVAGLTPRMRSHAQIHRHEYRGQTWYVLQDLATERFHRFSPAAYRVIGLMDGRRTVQEIWEIATEQLGDGAPSQDEVIELLGQLHAADALQCDIAPDTADLFRRYQKQRQRFWRGFLRSVFAWKIPLCDPEGFLSRLLPLVRPLVGPAGAFLWLSAVGPALVLAGMHWPELTRNVLDRLLAPQSLALLWLLFPALKIVHELGHGFAVKALGGEVHDMGVMILVLTPVPYVDASSASAFRSKWQRIAVGAAGMAVELFVASLALFLWLNVEPGIVRTLAYNALLIGGISTVLFNANPLLRFDGYYILGDLLEIPNLRSRSGAYLGYLCERYLFGRRDAELPGATAGERGWFVLYAVASSVYRVLVVIAIMLFIAGKFFVIGMLLAAMTAAAWLLFPLGKGLSFLFTHPRIRRVRKRALATSAVLAAAMGGFIALVPLPSRTQTEGVVWMPDESLVRAGTEGFIARVVAKPGARVNRGDVLIVCSDPELSTQIEALAARVRELEANYMEQWPTDLVKAEIIQEELRYELKGLDRARQRAAELVIRSRTGGTFVAPQAEGLSGRFVRQGELMVHVVDLETITVRTVVSQDQIDLVRHRTHRVEVRLAERVGEATPAVIRRIVPAATEELPSPALGSQGGGRIATDPFDTRGVKAIQKLFQVDLELPARLRVINVGGRVHVRFDHGWEPLLTQGYRRVRQLFLSRFHV